MVDPNYWKQQWFLAGDLRQMIPNTEKLCIVEMLPSDNKNLAYLCPDPEKDGRFDRYIAIGGEGTWEDDEALKQSLAQQSAFYTRCEPEYVKWVAGQRSSVFADCADVVLFGVGVLTKLGPEMVRGLQEAQRITKRGGRVVLVVNPAEEKRLGDLDDVVEAQLEGRRATGLLTEAGLEVASLRRDEGCGLTIALLTKTAAPTARKARAAPARRSSELREAGGRPVKGVGSRPAGPRRRSRR